MNKYMLTVLLAVSSAAYAMEQGDSQNEKAPQDKTKEQLQKEQEMQFKKVQEIASRLKSLHTKKEGEKWEPRADVDPSECLELWLMMDETRC